MRILLKKNSSSRDLETLTDALALAKAEGLGFLNIRDDALEGGKCSPTY